MVAFRSEREEHPMEVVFINDSRAFSSHDSSLLYLDDVENGPVHEEPKKHVDEEEEGWVPTEEKEHRPGHEQAQGHALRDGLQQDEVRAHGVAQLGPSKTGVESLFEFQKRFEFFLPRYTRKESENCHAALTLLRRLRA